MRRALICLNLYGREAVRHKLKNRQKMHFFVFLGCLCRYYLDSITLIETIVISSLCLFWSIHVKCQGHNHAGLCALHCRQYCCNQTTQARHSSWHTRKNSTIQLSFEFFIHLLPTIIAIKYWAIDPVLEDDELIWSFFLSRSSHFVSPFSKVQIISEGNFVVLNFPKINFCPSL